MSSCKNGKRADREDSRAQTAKARPLRHLSAAPAGELEDEEQGAVPKPLPDALPQPVRLPPPATGMVAPAAAPAATSRVPLNGEDEIDASTCCQDWKCNKERRSIDEIFIDFFIRPLVNRTLSFFSEPINVSLFLYYFVGMGLFRYLENWTYFESAYFLTVTATTVGYGDFAPVTPLGKIFTAFFCLYGLTVVLAALAPIVAFLHGDWREAIMKAFGASSKVDTTNLKLSMAEVNARINYTRRYILACLSPTLVCIMGALLYYFAIRENVPSDQLFYGIHLGGIVDGVYWSMITMTTIGYGDICPESFTARCLAIFFLPVGVMALADAVADIQMIGLRRAIRETDFGKLADECLLRDATRDADADEPNLEPELTEAEFLVDQLISNGLVDTDAIIAIRRQFMHLTRNGDFEKDEDRKLTPKLIYEEIRGRVERGDPVSLGAETVDVMMVDPTGADARKGAHAKAAFKWKSFHEWKFMSWQVRVKAKHADKKETMDEASRERKAKEKEGLNMNSFRMW